MKKLIVFIVLALSVVCCAENTTFVRQVEGAVLHTMQNAWQIVDTVTSAGDEPNSLGVTSRTKELAEALTGDNVISTFSIPSKWNGVRFRCIGITDGATITHQIYLGTVGKSGDCELSHAGQLAWTIGPQQSIYDQITFVGGGTFEPKAGYLAKGNDSGETAVVVSVSALTSGTWAGADAAGTITYRSATGTFTGSETVSIVHADSSLSDPNAYTHAASDLIDFELADTLTITAGAWGSSWAATSPADNATNAEAEIDIKGADFMVIATTTSSVDGKLLVKGY